MIVGLGVHKPPFIAGKVKSVSSGDYQERPGQRREGHQCQHHGSVQDRTLCNEFSVTSGRHAESIGKLVLSTSSVSIQH